MVIGQTHRFAPTFPLSLFSFHLSALIADRAHRKAEEAAEAVAPVIEAAAEVQVVGAVAAASAQRTRPVVAVAATAAEMRTVAVARSREEDAVAVSTGYRVTINAVLCCPGPSAAITQFVLAHFRVCR